MFSVACIESVELTS